MAQCAAILPDVVLMDVMMPVMDGTEATALITASCPGVQVIALTSFVDQRYVEKAIDAGAISYLLKDARPETLSRAIRDAMEGRGTIDSGAMKALMERPDEVGRDLTAREREVLALLAGGLSNKEIAQGSRSAWAPSGSTSATSSPSSAPPTAPRRPPSR